MEEQQSKNYSFLMLLIYQRVFFPLTMATTMAITSERKEKKNDVKQLQGKRMARYADGRVSQAAQHWRDQRCVLYGSLSCDSYYTSRTIRM